MKNIIKKTSFTMLVFFISIISKVKAIDVAEGSGVEDLRPLEIFRIMSIILPILFIIEIFNLIRNCIEYKKNIDVIVQKKIKNHIILNVVWLILIVALWLIIVIYI